MAEHGNRVADTDSATEISCHTPNTRIFLTSSPGAIRVERARTRIRRARMYSQYRRRRATGPAADGEEGPSAARSLTYEADAFQQLPSTSRPCPVMPVNRVLLDYQREVELRGSSAADPENVYARHDSDAAIVNRLLFKARESFSIDERALLCVNCGRLPLMPVTSSCGHTRCQGCIQEDQVCPCGISHAPWVVNVNIMAQEVIQKVLSTEKDLRHWMSAPESELPNPGPQVSPPAPGVPGYEYDAPLDNAAAGEKDPSFSALSRVPTPDAAEPAHPIGEGEHDGLNREPITPQVRLNYASYLIQKGKFLEAGPHLARLSAAASDVAQPARRMFFQIITELSNTVDISEVEKQLCDAIAAQATTEWLGTRDLGCVFCCDTLSDPVTTPCGHTFCRQCLERSLDYRTTCALCMQVLNDFKLQEVCVTEAVRVALEGIGAVKPPEPRDPNLIPILACTVTFPGMPCPLFLFEPRYRYMVRRILESESRRFGLVVHERQSGVFSEYGTILELRECVHLRNGCTIVSTIGVSRFKVVERDIFDGWCDVARVDPVVDMPILDKDIVDGLRSLARHISFKAALWLSCFSNEMRIKIQRTFGAMPYIDIEGEWWKSPDGPVWLWWIISTLPLALEIKVLMLATDCLLKRMRAVMRTLDNSLAQTRQSLFEYELTLKEWWEQRHL